MNLFRYIEENTIRLEASHRGGGIEIDASEYTGIENACMTAYQNYLGGGMLGSIQSDRNFSPGSDAQCKRARELSEALIRYYYNITNDIVQDWDEWAASESLEAQQSRPSSAY